jgi:hypothetical protein
MKRLAGFLCIAFLGAGTLALGGCSGRDASSIPQASADATLVSSSRAPDVAAAAAVPAAAAVDAFTPTAADEPIPNAAAPDIAGTYAGTGQDRTPSVGSVDRGTIRLVLHQNGSSVSGTIDLKSREGGTVYYTFTGTVATTAKGAIVHMVIQGAAGRTIGAWAKVIGTTMFGKGWADPDAQTFQDYEQLLFTMHKKA